MGLFQNVSYFIAGYHGRLVLFIQTSSSIFLIGITFLAAIWLLYFLSRLRSLSKKIHYLKKQTDERCKQELTNARVDYIKSLFIAAICACEILQTLAIVPIEVSLYLLKPYKLLVGNCTLDGNNQIFSAIFHHMFIRCFIAAVMSSFLTYTSLVHILTSYLSNAYADKRVIKLTKRELFMFVLLLTQLVTLWLSVIYWRAFLVFAFVLCISVFPIHLFLFHKYSSKLYVMLQRRRLDAWFEQEGYVHERLQQMSKDYRWGAILYVLAMVFWLSAILFIFILEVIRFLFTRSCSLNFILFNSDYPWLSHVYTQHPEIMDLVLTLNNIFYSTLVCFAVFFMFLLHASILYKAVRRLLQRRRAYNRHAGVHYNHMYQPLIGNK
ncbi:hypothetical protein LOD99_13896 [Oopsacas minuta]|uniref:Uncharacterized protein n=1 Tax=Oopsacas minuta TaxID=111878 RepID=A0AAV7KHG6_9METZ|nr:hypothetical protein LOD99_13896 [Oopsacas minuta]